MNRTAFVEFLEIAREWRPHDTLRYGAIQLEFDACVLRGHTEAEILHGARIYTEHYLPKIPYPTAPQKWLLEVSFLGYQKEPRKYRALTAEERRAWEESGLRVPERVKEGEESRPPGLRVVG